VFRVHTNKPPKQTKTRFHQLVDHKRSNGSLHCKTNVQRTQNCTAALEDQYSVFASHYLLANFRPFPTV